MTIEDKLKDLGLTADQIAQLMIKIGRVFLKSDSIDQFYASLQTICGPKSKEVALIIINEKFLPLADEIGGVRELLKKLEGESQNLVGDEIDKIKRVDSQKTQSPATVFSTDDDAEIQQYKNDNQSSAAPNYEQLADAIITEFGYTTLDEMLLKRLKTNVIARLRGVRDNLEAREVLEKNKKVGGLEFTSDQASSLLRLIAQRMPKTDVAISVAAPITFPVKKPFANTGKVSLQTKREATPAVKPTTPIADQAAMTQLFPIIPSKPVVLPPSSPSVQPIIEEEDGLPVIRYAPQTKVVSSDSAVSDAPVTNVPMDISKSADKAPQEIITSSVAPQVMEPVAQQVAPVQRQEVSLPPAQPAPYAAASSTKIPLAVSRKPSLDGVKLVKQSVGPLDELSGMTLIDFRRLAPNPEAAVDKIFEKVELLSKEGYGRRLEGIAAWQMSEVSRFYRLLGQASLNNHQSIEEVITERLKTEKPTLTLAEFEAVVALNGKLRH